MPSAIPVRTLVPGVLAVLLLAAVCAFSLATSSSPVPIDAAKPSLGGLSPTLPPDSSPAVALFDEADRRLAHQAEVDAGLAKELASGVYTLDDPLVVVDPYGVSPLTAVVLFRTATPTVVSVHVAGDDVLSSVDATLTDSETDHVVPVYGLYAGRTNEVTLDSRDGQGSTTTKTLGIATEPENQDLANLTVQTDLRRPDLYQPGLNFPYAMDMFKTAYDENGAFRWYLKDWYLIPTDFTFHGHFIVSEGAVSEGAVLLYEIDPLGRIYRVLYTPYGAHHEILTYKEDRLLLAGSSGATVEDLVYEISPDTGKILQTLDLKTVLQRSRPGLAAVDSPDWLHLNAIVEVPGTDDILISSRHQSVVARIAWPSGAIDWMLAPPYDWSFLFQKFLLKPTGSDFAYAFNQHAPEILPDQDGNPDTMDILLFDNGDQRFAYDKDLQRRILANEVVAPTPYSRLVQYRIDEKAGTVARIWEYGKDTGSLLYSDGRGDADLLANGTILGTYAVTHDKVLSGVVLEVSRAGEIVWQSLATSKSADGTLETYRTLRMSIYEPGTTETRISTPALDLIPEEVLAKYGRS